MSERAALTILLNAVWLQLLVAAIAWLVLRRLREAGGNTRYGVLSLALAASLLVPAAVVLPRVHFAMPAAPAAAPAAAPVTHAPKHAALAKTAASAPLGASKTGPLAGSNAKPAMSGFAIAKSVVRAAVLVWAAIAFALLVRLAIGFAHLERLKRDALPLPVDYRKHLHRWSAAAGRDVRLCVSDDTVVPIAVGWFDMMVLIPNRLIDELAPDDLDRVVLHEIAHLRRRDAAMLIVQQLGSALFFFSPGLAWIVRQLELEREVACDDWVVNEQADAAPYASCLVRLAEGTPWPHRALAAPGAFVTRRSMSIRIERILQRTRGMRMKPARGPMAVTLVAMLALVFLAVTVAPTIAYSDECDGQPAHAYSAYTGSGLTLPGLTLQPYGPATHASAAQVHGAPVHAASVQPLPSKVTAPRDVQPAASRVAVRTSTVQGTDVQTQTRYSVTQRQALYAPILIAAASPAAGDYIDAIQSALGQRLTPEQLIELKSVDVTPQDVHAWHAAGYPAIRVRDLVAAKSVGLSPATFASLKSAFGTVTFDDAIAAQSMGVDTQYRSQLSAAGLKDLTLRMLVSLKSLDVTPAYVSQANALGFGTLTASQIEELKAMNIDAAYVQRVRSHGFNDLTLRQIVELKASGVIK